MIILEKSFWFLLRPLILLSKRFVFVRDNSIIVIVLQKIGDTVFTLPALKFLYGKFGKKLKIITFSQNAPILKRVFPSELILFENSDFVFNNRIPVKSVFNILRNIKPETVYDLTAEFRSAIVTAYLRPNNSIGFNRELFRGVYSRFYEKNINLHSIDMYLSVAAESETVDPSLKLMDIKSELHGKILIVADAGWEAKQWGYSKFFELQRLLSVKYDICYITLPGKLDEDFRHEFIKEKLNFKEIGEVELLIREIESAALFIGNDSGPYNIARWLGVPTLTIFGPTNPAFIAPSEDFHRVMQKKIACTPSEKERYCFTFAGRIGCPSFECMHLLSVHEVYEETMKFAEYIKNKYAVRISPSSRRLSE